MKSEDYIKAQIEVIKAKMASNTKSIQGNHARLCDHDSKVSVMREEVAETLRDMNTELKRKQADLHLRLHFLEWFADDTDTRSIVEVR